MGLSALDVGEAGAAGTMERREETTDDGYSSSGISR
jgi:hypothetical protein